jgi:GNAT superfamily N-acetyltransferase
MTLRERRSHARFTANVGQHENEAMPELIVGSPAKFSNLEIDYFIACVRAGDEVSVQGLVARIRNAVALVFAKIDGGFVGVAALKRPQPSYRGRISSASGATLSAAEFPFELGWVSVSPEARRQGLSFSMSEAALGQSGGAGVFATSHVDNIAMHRSLEKLGFQRAGDPYPSGRARRLLQVFVRPAAQPCSQQDAA